MSIDDEIRKKKESMQAAVDAEARRQADANRLQEALRNAGMQYNTPIIRMPSEDLRAVISETMTRMIFNVPKIVRNLPDGTTRARHIQNVNNKKERADDYSFDVDVKVEKVDKSTYTTSIWFFKNGSVAFCKDNLNIDNLGVQASVVREKIIEAIANAQVERPTSNTSNSNNKKTGRCYIATAVYGSYDCPEVWTLRRYRDYSLNATWYGKAFIKIYYALSPMLVKVFGNTKWFQFFWRLVLDNIIVDLKRKGISDRPYDD